MAGIITNSGDIVSQKETNQESNDSMVDYWKIILAFSYIRVFKLNCPAGKIWIQEYNQHDSLKIYT